MKISNSRVNTYQACPHLYYWKFIQNLVPLKEAVPLLVGRAVHAGLAAHYAQHENAEHHAKGVFDQIKSGGAWLGPELEVLNAQQEYVTFILHEYKKQWPKEPWEVLAPEVEGSVPIGSHEFFFRTDAIVSWKGHPWLLEHKTTAQLGPTFFRKFRMDGQITLYIYSVWKTLNVRPVGAVVNAICKARKLDSVSFARDIVMRSEQQVENFIPQFVCQVDRIATLPIDDPSAWPYHTTSCVQYNRTCDYLELCYTDTPDTRLLFAERPPDYVDLGGEE